MGKSYIFKCENGKLYVADEGTCLSCKNCSDVFWDYTNGPYLCFCEKNYNYGINCPEWEEDKTMEQWKEGE